MDAFFAAPENLARLALLLLGHVLADFVFQTGDMVRRKARLSGLAQHAALVLAAHVLAFAPYLTPRALLVLGGLTVVHAAVDFAKTRLPERRRDGLLALAVDQALHLAALLGAWLLLAGPSAGPAWHFPDARMLAAIGFVGAAYLFNLVGASIIVERVLDAFRGARPSEEDAPKRMGRAIGMLERSLVLTLVLADTWEGVGLVVAAKAVARYPQFKKDHFADYFLLGTLTSFTIAVVLGLALKATMGW